MIHVGVIGVGAMGRHHARVYAQLPAAELVALADTDAARVNELAARYRCRAYTDYRAMLAQERLDAVSVAAPTRAHYPIALDTLRAGVHTLVEKPLASTIAEAEALVQAARDAQVILAVGHVERFNPAVQELKRRIDAGELGALTSIVARRVGIMPPRVKDVDVILDLAVHDIDVVMFLLGRAPDYVNASASRALLSDRFDHSEIFLKFGAVGCFIQANWITPIKIRTLSVTGDRGHAELNYVTQKLEIFESTLAREYDDFGDFVVRFGTPRSTTAPISPREPLHIELDCFLQAVAGQGANIVRSEDAMRALAVAFRARAAVAALGAEP